MNNSLRVAIAAVSLSLSYQLLCGTVPSLGVADRSAYATEALWLYNFRGGLELEALPGISDLDNTQATGQNGIPVDLGYD